MSNHVHKRGLIKVFSHKTFVGQNKISSIPKSLIKSELPRDTKDYFLDKCWKPGNIQKKELLALRQNKG